MAVALDAYPGSRTEFEGLFLCGQSATSHGFVGGGGEGDFELPDAGFVEGGRRRDEFFFNGFANGYETDKRMGRGG
jgi:hypothetical protein